MTSSGGGRLDTVEIALASGEVSIPWESREKLVAHLKDSGRASGAVKAFEAVGAAIPVTLTDIDKWALAGAIGAWSRQIKDPVPDRIASLYHALVEDGRAAARELLGDKRGTKPAARTGA